MTVKSTAQLKIDDANTYYDNNSLNIQPITVRTHNIDWMDSFFNRIDDKPLLNVIIASLLSGHIIYFNGTNWVNSTLGVVLGYTPADDSRVVHIAGAETITGSKIFSSGTSFGDVINNSYTYIGPGLFSLVNGGSVAFMSSNGQIGFSTNSGGFNFKHQLPTSPSANNVVTWRDLTGIGALLSDLSAYAANSALTTETNSRISGDAATLASANTYTDSAISSEATTRANADNLKAPLNSPSFTGTAKFTGAAGREIDIDGNTLIINDGSGRTVTDSAIGAYATKRIQVAGGSFTIYYPNGAASNYATFEDKTGYVALAAYSINSSGIAAFDSTGKLIIDTSGKVLSSNDYTSTEKAKLAGIATGATANSSDATLLNRANHTGTQLASTISDFLSSLLGSVLTGLYTATSNVITATDTVLSAMGKLQAQISANVTNIANNATGISNEVSNRTSADNNLQTNINTNSTAIASRVAYSSVATYALMIAAGTPAAGMTIFKVAVDENKGINNSEYHWWASGKRIWIATTEDN